MSQERTFLASAWTDLRWRTDYNAARKEALRSGLPILIDFGTADCFWCKKLDAVTFRDPRVANLMNQRFVLLKIDADRELHLANQLEIESYPTLILAESSGKILTKVKGYKDADAFHEILKQTLASVQAPEPLQQDYQTALQHVQQRNYASALPLFRAIAADPRGASCRRRRRNTSTRSKSRQASGSPRLASSKRRGASRTRSMPSRRRSAAIPAPKRPGWPPRPCRG